MDFRRKTELVEEHFIRDDGGHRGTAMYQKACREAYWSE